MMEPESLFNKNAVHEALKGVKAKPQEKTQEVMNGASTRNQFFKKKITDKSDKNLIRKAE